MKSSKKKSSWFLSFYTILMVTLGAMALFCVFLADKINRFRPEEWNDNFMLMFIETLGFGHFDVLPKSYVMIGALYFICVLEKNTI